MGKESLIIGFEIYRLENPANLPKPLDSEFFKSHQPVGDIPNYIDLREVSNRFRVKPGMYCIIPTTYEAGEEGEFIIRVFTETGHDMVEYDMDIGFKAGGEMNPQWDSQELEAVKKFFNEVAGEDMEVS
eukprot:Gregarina_sp_Poly_1__8448@NODE_4981_length_440_cov_1_833780_g3474_i0_p1_GENE_NODE_4981_length_440_cov_1_833780_g3474_i0NODE_4981_length_440_cov_1_833780_g3474_i0_p1_ORF_typecomplete_len146_score20_93Calpain_III/PF01067_22/3_1e28Calpain_III/PF01067_22/8_8e03_NODE_4981_length_440_cov_1_833780_g3474_i053439